MSVIAKRPTGLRDHPTSFCAGCNHGTVMKILMELVDEMDIFDRTICVLPVGCSVPCHKLLNVNHIGAAHGRATAVATGIKRCMPDHVVFSYQGDGDLASIGLAETLSAANRGEKFTAIFINNAIYGMTGGQMAPTTLAGQWASTAVNGRDPVLTGYPMDMCKIVDTLKAPSYIARFAMNTPANVRKCKAGIKHALELQMRGEAFSLIEILSVCPTNWKMDPIPAQKFLEEKMIPEYPLGVFRDVGEAK